MIHRYSSGRSSLKDFLTTQLQGARRYERITRIFSSSLSAVPGEALERMTPEDGETCVRGGLQLLPQSPGSSDRPGGQVGDAPRMVYSPASRAGGRRFVTNGLVAARVNCCSRSCRKLSCQKRDHELPHRLQQNFWMRAEGIARLE